MNPATIAALLQTVAQLALIVEELKQGLITQQQAWAAQQQGLDSAIQAWNAATSASTKPVGQVHTA